MSYKSEAELRAWAADAIPKLQNVGITAGIDSVHDYLIKLSIAQESQSFGRLNIYHKPSKGQFKLDSGELRNALIVLPKIQAALSGVHLSERTATNTRAENADDDRDENGTSVIRAASRPRTANFNADPAAGLDGWHIFVDGSYLRGRVGYGVVILRDGELHHTLNGVVTDPAAKAVHQIAGELMATMEALRWCAAQGITSVHIHHDYTGIAFWATGQWKTNTTVTQDYAAFMRAQAVQVTWHKVAAHTGNYWNEMADRLAGGKTVQD